MWLRDEGVQPHFLFPVAHVSFLCSLVPFVLSPLRTCFCFPVSIVFSPSFIHSCNNIARDTITYVIGTQVSEVFQERVIFINRVVTPPKAVATIILPTKSVISLNPYPLYVLFIAAS